MLRRFLILIPLLLLVAGGDLAGRYQGEWSSTNTGLGGDFRLSLEPSNDGWKCEVVFTLGSDEVKTAIRYVRVAPDQIEAQYDFTLADSQLRSTIKGKRAGKGLEGEYRTQRVSDGSAVDAGSWKATAR